MSRIATCKEIKSRLMASRGWREGIWRLTANGCRMSFWHDENVLKLLIMAVQPCGYTKKHLIIYFTEVNFMAVNYI
jgi:hypothetical protein